MRRCDIQRGAALAFFTLLTAGHAAQPIDIKGVALGGTEQDVMKAHPKAVCGGTDSKVTGDRVCRVSTTYAGAPATIAYVFYGERTELANIYVASKDLRDIVAVMEERFGRGERREMATGGVMVQWKPATDYYIMAAVNAKQPQNALIQFTTVNRVIESERRQKQEKADRAKDL